MALSDYKVPTRTIALSSDDFFEVRGLSLFDISSLIVEQGPAIREFFDRYAENGKFASGADPIEAMMEVINKAPDLACAIIVLASDDPKSAPVIRRLAMGIQLEAIQGIAALTFEASGGPGKFVEALSGLLSSLGGLASGASASMIGSQA